MFTKSFETDFFMALFGMILIHSLIEVYFYYVYVQIVVRLGMFCTKRRYETYLQYLNLKT